MESRPVLIRRQDFKIDNAYCATGVAAQQRYHRLSAVVKKPTVFHKIGCHGAGMDLECSRHFLSMIRSEAGASTVAKT
jgi:hypothetical protein